MFLAHPPRGRRPRDEKSNACSRDLSADRAALGGPLGQPTRARANEPPCGSVPGYAVRLVPPSVVFATPRKLPKPADLKGRVVVLDLAFASEASGGGFDKITRPFIEGLGPRLAAWVDHHDHVFHARYADDPRFVLATKAQHGACPEMISPALVERIGAVDVVVCHGDFDGLCAAAKWMRGGIEPYAGADDDARAIDTRIGKPSAIGTRFDRAIRARGRDAGLMGLVVRHLATGLADASLWEPIDAAAAELAAREATTRRVAERYRIVAGTAGMRVEFLDASDDHDRYDKTELLLMGQERAKVAVLRDRDTVTLAAAFDSGLNFLTLLGLSGGMPTLVSIHANRLGAALSALGVGADDAAQLA